MRGSTACGNLPSDAVLGRLLAVRLVGPSRPEDFAPGVLEEIRSALLEQRWADAVTAWMLASGEVLDGYPDDRRLKFNATSRWSQGPWPTLVRSLYVAARLGLEFPQTRRPLSSGI